MIEMKKEIMYDLFSQTEKKIKIKKDKKGPIICDNLTEFHIKSKEDLYLLIEKALEKISLSDNHSKSHIIFMLKMTKKFPDNTLTKSLFTVVDLSAVEKVLLV